MEDSYMYVKYNSKPFGLSCHPLAYKKRTWPSGLTRLFFYINNVHFIINTARVKYLIIVFYNHEALTLDCFMALLDFIKGTNGNSF